VITGAASGIGFALAELCVEKGIKVVLADIEEPALARAESDLRKAGADVMAVVTDAASREDIRNLAKTTLKTYRRVDLLFNNAGVAAGPALWESTLNDCRWVIDVNLWGMIYCLREFIPLMLEQDTPGHIVNTSSIAGLSTYHPSALYHLTKHGIVALSEQLYHDLALRGAKIGVSVLCPGFVNTRIMDAERNRPAAYANESSRTAGPADPMEEMFRQMVAAGMPPPEVAQLVFQAIAKKQFFIFTHPDEKSLIKMRMSNILAGRNPVLPPPPDGIK